MRTMHNMLFSGLCLIVVAALIESRPQNSLTENNQDLETIEPQMEEVRGSYYDLAPQSTYQGMPLEKLQMLYDLNRRAAYLRTPSLNDLDQLYRMPEAKRQVRYRQCYFNPISCFKK